METSNLLVAQAIASSVKSLLGPNNSVKCCVSGDGCSLICSSAAKVLECIDVQHPAGYVINDACQGLFKTLGCGCKTFVCLSGFWGKASQLIYGQGVPIPAILKHFKEALRECEAILDDLAITLASSSFSDAQAMGTDASIATNSDPAVSRSSVSSSKRDKGSHAVPKRDKFGSSFYDKISPHQERRKRATGQPAVRTQEFTKAYTSALHKRLTDQGATNTSKQTHRMIKGSRYFSADSNSTPSSLLLEGNTKVTLSECDDSSTTLQAATQLGDCGARRNVRDMLDVLGVRLCHGKENEMKLAVEAVYSQFVNSNKHSLSDFQVQKNMIHVELVVGPPIHFSHVLDGFVLECNTLSEEIDKVLPTSALELSVVLVNNDITPHCQHLGYRETAKVYHTLQGSDISKGSIADKDLWIRRIVHILQVHKINILVSKGVVDESLVDYCISSKTLLIQNVSSSKLKNLCHVTSASLVSYLTHMRWSDIGKLADIKPWKLSWTHAESINSTQRSRYVVVKGQLPHIQTAVLCGTCRDVVCDTELKFWNCFSRLKNALACGRVLPGAGVSEIACIDHLHQSADQAGGDGFRSLVYSAFSQGLQEFLVNTLHNSGRFSSPLHTLWHVLFSRTGTMTDIDKNVMAETAEGRTHSEKHGSLQCLGDDNYTRAGCVCDDYLAKKEAWRRAVDMTCLLLQTDMFIITGAGN